jgi:two-component system, response regulator
LTAFMGELNNGENTVRVLVIEDNADDRELLLHQLRRGNMAEHVKFISDGQEALDFLVNPVNAAQSNQIVAIFLDLNLPSLSGIEVLRSLRDHSTLRTTPVIVMTSSNNPKDLAECQRLMVTNYVSKPVTFISFSKAVADVFHRPKVTAEESA